VLTYTSRLSCPWSMYMYGLFYAWNIEQLQRFSRSDLFNNSSEYINSFWECFQMFEEHYCLNKYLASRGLDLHFFFYIFNGKSMGAARKLLIQGVTFQRREPKLYSFICSHLNIHFNQPAYKWDWQRCYP